MDRAGIPEKIPSTLPTWIRSFNHPFGGLIREPLIQLQVGNLDLVFHNWADNWNRAMSTSNTEPAKASLPNLPNSLPTIPIKLDLSNFLPLEGYYGLTSRGIQAARTCNWIHSTTTQNHICQARNGGNSVTQPNIWSMVYLRQILPNLYISFYKRRDQSLARRHLLGRQCQEETRQPIWLTNKSQERPIRSIVAWPWQVRQGHGIVLDWGLNVKIISIIIVQQLYHLYVIQMVVPIT